MLQKKGNQVAAVEKGGHGNECRSSSIHLLVALVGRLIVGLAKDIRCHFNFKQHPSFPPFCFTPFLLFPRLCVCTARARLLQYPAVKFGGCLFASFVGSISFLSFCFARGSLSQPKA